MSLIGILKTQTFDLNREEACADQLVGNCLLGFKLNKYYEIFFKKINKINKSNLHSYYLKYLIMYPFSFFFFRSNYVSCQKIKSSIFSSNI